MLLDKAKDGWAASYPLLLLAFAIAIAAGAVPGNAMSAGLDEGSPWPMFHRDTNHGGRTSNPLPAVRMITWAQALSDTVEYSSPVIAANGTIYIGDQGKELWAFNSAGYRLWNYHTGGNIRYSTPAVGADGTVYVGSADGNLYAIRADGTLRWAALTGGAVKTSPAIAPDGTIYVGSDDRKLWAFRPDGTARWTYVTGDTVRSSPVIGSDGTVYFGSNDGSLYAVWPTGILRWSGATGGPIKGSPAIGQGGDVIFGSGDEFLYSLRSTGDFNWATFVGENIRCTPSIGITGKIYLAYGTSIAAFHDEGDEAWAYDTGAPVLSTPAVHTRADMTEVVVCGSDTGQLLFVDNGILLGAVTLGGPVRSSPAISADAHVYVGAMNGILYAIGAPLVTGVDPVEGSVPSGALRLIAGPNPLRAGDALNLRLSQPLPTGGVLMVTDASGRQLLRRETSGDLRLDRRELDRSLSGSGVYLLRWSDGRRTATGSLVYVR